MQDAQSAQRYQRQVLASELDAFDEGIQYLSHTYGEVLEVGGVRMPTTAWRMTSSYDVLDPNETMKRASNEMVVPETSSPVINMLVRVLCDRRSSWDLKSQAGDLIGLQARYNAVMEREKRAGTLAFSDDPDSDVAHTVSVSLYHAWEATKDGPNLEPLRDLIADCIVRMRRVLEELG